MLLTLPSAAACAAEPSTRREQQRAAPVVSPASRRQARSQRRPRSVRACAEPEDAKTDATEEKEGSALPQWLLDAVTSPLAYVTLGVAVGVRVVGASDTVQSVVLLSALPVVGLSVLARTPAGLALQAGLAQGAEERRAAKERVAAERTAARLRLVDEYGPTRRLLVTPAPTHLVGELPADMGFDPLGLAREGRLSAMRSAELLHARWAMLGIPGALIPEALARAGVDIGESVWWRVGAAKLNGEVLNYAGLEGFHIAGGQGILVIAACQLVLMGGPEYARYVGIDSLEPVGIPLPGDADYPGGPPFDPLRLADDPVFYERQRGIELHVGRAAMVAFAGFAAQAAATREGPLENLLS